MGTRKKMNPTWKTKWLTALRSGKYTQSQFTLTNGSRYCCLGVAHDVLVKNKQATWDEPLGITATPAINADLLGSKQLAILGMTDATQKALATMNDDEGLGFPAIADWIEENL